jgi:hypothetical protein
MDVDVQSPIDDALRASAVASYQGHTKTQCYIYKVKLVTIGNNIKNHGAQW